MKKIRELLQNEFSRNLMTMVSGNALAQAIPVLANVALGRLYSPEEIGSYAFFFTVVNILAIVSSLKYNEAIVLSGNDAEYKGLLQLSILLTCCFSGLVLVLCIAFSGLITAYIEHPMLHRYLYLLPLAVWLLGLFATLNFVSNKFKDYKVIAGTRVVQNLSTAVVQIAAFPFSVLGLIIGYLSGLVLSLLQYLRQSSRILTGKFDRANMQRAFVKYRDFARYYMPAAFVNKLSYGLPIILLPLYYDLSIAGYFSYSSLIVLGPMSILSASMQQVFYQKIASMEADGEALHPYLLATYKKLFRLGLLPHVVLFLFAPWIFSVVFGAQWETSGEYTRYLMPWFFMIFMNTSVSSIYVVRNRQKQVFVMEILILAVRFLALYAGYMWFGSGKHSIVFYGIAGFAYELVLLFYYLKISKNAKHHL